MDYSKESDSRDQLSELPTCLILVILSFLPTRDVIITTLLSKRWKHLWTTLPCLDLKNRSFVCEAIQLNKGYKIMKLNFRFDYFQTFHSSHIRDSLHHFAIENQVEEQYMNVASRCCSLRRSIRKLSFVSYALEIDDNVQWNKLQSLTIDQGSEPLSDGVINQFLSDVPDLEILNLSVYDCREELIIRSSCLKFFKMERLCFPIVYGCENEPMLTIWAPNLQRLEISGSPYGRCLLNVPSLTNAVLDFHGRAKAVQEAYVSQVLASIHHVEKLTLSDRCIEVLFEMKKNKKDRFVAWSNKFLKFYAKYSTDKMVDVLEMFPQLTTLVIERKDLNMSGRWLGDVATTSSEETNMVRFKRSFLPQLRRVEIKWHLHHTSLQVVVETLLKNAPMLEKMVFSSIPLNGCCQKSLWPKRRCCVCVDPP